MFSNCTNFSSYLICYVRSTCTFIALCSMALGKSSMYTRNNNGPKIEPCNTPYFILVNFETVRIKVRVNVLNSLISGRDSSVGMANRYGLDGPGIESRWGREFLHPSRPPLGPSQAPIQRVPCLSRV